MTEKEFTSLVPELRQTALHVCRGCGTDGVTAEDVAQDTMLRLWAIRKDITSAQHAKGLTGCVAKHFCIDSHRKSGKSPCCCIRIFWLKATSRLPT